MLRAGFFNIPPWRCQSCGVPRRDVISWGKKGGARPSLTAHMERAQSDCAGSASKKDSLAPPYLLILLWNAKCRMMNVGMGKGIIPYSSFLIHHSLETPAPDKQPNDSNDPIPKSSQGRYYSDMGPPPRTHQTKAVGDLSNCDLLMVTLPLPRCTTHASVG